MGPHRQGRGDGESQGSRRRCRLAGAPSSIVERQHGAYQSGDAGRRRGHHGHPGRAGTGERRLSGLPGGAGAVHRWAYGPTGRDLSHSRLYSRPQNDGCRSASQHQSTDLQRGRRGFWVRGQFRRSHPQARAVGERGVVHRLRGVRGEMPPPGRG